MRDITERKRMEEALRESEKRSQALSITDELTGLYNRRQFYEVLENEVARTTRYGYSFSLAILDLDGFKQFNDKFGHTKGDSLLRSFAETLESTLRKADAAFRYGGDEFAIILPTTKADKAKTVVERIRTKWLRVLEAEHITLEKPLGFSVGVGQFPENAETAEELVLQADAALYRAKREGGYKTTLAAELGPL